MVSEYIQHGKIASGKRQLPHEKAVDLLPMEVFYSYSHTDEKLRKELEKHLSLLKRQRYITT